MVGFIDKTLFVLGGMNYEEGALKSVETYDFQTNTWNYSRKIKPGRKFDGMIQINTLKITSF